MTILQPDGLPDRNEAGAGLLAVDEHRAGAAIARIAADLGSGQAEFVAQGIGEPRDRRNVERDRLAIDGETEARAGARQHGAKLRKRTADEFDGGILPVFLGRAHVIDRRERAQMLWA